MKIALLVFMIIVSLTSLNSSAQSDYSVKWEVTGIFNTIELEYDFDLGSKYISAHGTETNSNGFKRPSTGVLTN
jgi:hypothetical protein